MADQGKGVPRAPGGEAAKTQPSSYQDFLDALHWPPGAAPAPPRSSAEAVLCALSRRLSAEHLQERFEQLPKRFQELLQACPKHAGPGAPQVTDEAFVAEVASHLGLAEPQADRVVRAVFDGIRDRLSEEENEEVAGQLPELLAELWRRLS